MHLNWLFKRADAPFQDSRDRVILLFEAEREYIFNRASDHSLVVKPRQLESASATSDHACLAVANEEGRIRSREVIIQQLEYEAKTAFSAAFWLRTEASCRINGGRTVTALWTDEVMSHVVRTRVRVRGRFCAAPATKRVLRRAEAQFLDAHRHEPLRYGRGRYG